MGQPDLVLLAILGLGALGRNPLVTAAAGILLLLRLLGLASLLPALEQHAMSLGLVLLIVAVLIPFADGQVTLQQTVQSFTRGGLAGYAGLVAGFVAAVLGARGIVLLEQNPHVIIGLIFGTLVGVAFFQGIPVGPLTAAGFAAVLMELLSLLRRGF
ncbi:DUF441 domain-containing protein [Thermaerobacter subterraneus]|uniref:UPF0756 membrane protein ThesuDRAFT_01725 n=1 Tax=Thermaerobacter subterraneus DSM 13965 TaxID=867903 RepID=K6QC46_9FIRM|nr:DUF441 domain-containing protein [Thermaerobacter subterraneus]EKP94001.1 putative membrane protein [Thermaerobacter subterraneus DSM 13965]